MNSVSQHFLYMALEIVTHSRPNSKAMNRRKFRLQFTANGEAGWGGAIQQK